MLHRKGPQMTTYRTEPVADKKMRIATIVRPSGTMRIREWGDDRHRLMARNESELQTIAEETGTVRDMLLQATLEAFMRSLGVNIGKPPE